VDQHILFFVLVGFVAQMIDGALGMAYGVSASTFLLSSGVSPVLASASVHAAEIFTTAVSGTSHWRLGNVDKDLVKRLALPGVAGAVLGAYVLTAIPGEIIKPFVSVYLLVMGLRILLQAANYRQRQSSTKNIGWLGLIGGFLDVCGGGGWGPVVTSTLVANGNTPRYAIGSVNITEFFVTVAASVTFVLTIGLIHWQVILGLAIGGSLAAPLAAYICQRLPHRALMIMVGLVIVFLSIRTLYTMLG
jgi:uncharacterized membrane protein YfcA